MRRSRKFCQRGSNFNKIFFNFTFFFNFFIFLADEELGDSNTTKAGHHRPASETAFYWRADGGPTLNDGLVTL